MTEKKKKKILRQYAAGVSRVALSDETALSGKVSGPSLRSAKQIGGLWRGLDGIWRDTEDKAVNITQKMQSGRFFNLLEPSPNDFTDADLAIGLSREHRWSGQTTGKFGYSVAQHSVAMVAYFASERPRADRDFKMYALLHDAEEGLGVKDTITGLKMVFGQAYIEIANSISEAVHLKYGLIFPPPAKILKEIKKADAKLGMTEAIHLMGFSEGEYRDRISNWSLNPVRDQAFVDEYIQPWHPRKAEESYMELIEELSWK